MDPFSTHRETLTVAQAAKVCGVNRVTMWRWVKANDLPSTTTLGGHHRIRKSDLTSFIQADDHGVRRAGAKSRILVVDDDPQIRKLMCRTIEMHGHAVETCSNGFEAGIRVMRFKPQLIVLDLFMPFMDGFRVCQLLKEDQETAAIKVIAISGNATREDIGQVLDQGADLFLKKPLKTTELIQNVESLLRPQLSV